MRYFIDTSYLYALLNSRDAVHEKAVEAYGMLSRSDELYVTDVILCEFANSMGSKGESEVAADYIDEYIAAENIEVVFTDEELFIKGLEKFRLYKDKRWGLADCISFAVMERYKIDYALTWDKHFEQAGFTAVMRRV
jgi:uncharacterized protein